jgi:hypothetical protein
MEKMVTKKKAPKPKTPEEIKAEIVALREVHDKVRRRSYFGTDNRACIDAQIVVLEEDLDEDEIDERFMFDETSDDFEEGDREIYHAAQDARAWIEGTGDEPSLVAGWKELVQGG